MKPSFYCSLVILLISIAISSYTAGTAEKPTLQVAIQGMEGQDILKEGVARTEFALMTIETDQEGTAVKKFEVILARGSSPIERFEVNAGNSMDLREFADSARSGDRLVIDIKEVSGIEQADIFGAAYVISIPVK